MEAAHSSHSFQYHKAHHVFSTLCLNMQTYMTTVAAIGQIPVSEAHTTVLEERKGH
jgi:hypothetical protein